MTARANPEYLRRNLVVCGSYGAQAAVNEAIERLSAAKRKPKWLLELLNGAADRLTRIPPELASWRDAAADHDYP